MTERMEDRVFIGTILRIIDSISPEGCIVADIYKKTHMERLIVTKYVRWMAERKLLTGVKSRNRRAGMRYILSENGIRFRQLLR